ncbi:MAG: hypothetical protein ACOYMF_14235 [Bacteroidales bacterium]
MEQKDYLLREIEKIGFLLNEIFNILAGKGGNSSLTIENQFADARALLLHETGFDIDVFLLLEGSETEQYISKFHSMNTSNIELLADIITTMGMSTESAGAKEYLQRALQLYELCNSSDKTFSFDRESKISGIKNAL